MAPPPFFFRIFGMQQAPNRTPTRDHHGRWSPLKQLGGNIRDHQNTSLWCCDSDSMVAWSGLPEGTVEYKTYSIYFMDGVFWIVDYDATRYQVGDGLDPDSISTGYRRAPIDEDRTASWQMMTFEHHAITYASTATFGSSDCRLCLGRSDQRWINRLLPSGHLPTEWWGPCNYGGMNGELPLILGILAFSVHSTQMDWFFRNYFRNGEFMASHEVAAGSRYNGRGMVVTVWREPGLSTIEELQTYENGQYGNIFN